jgi:hypothetical protein
VFIDNLFTSTKFLEFLRSNRISATDTCQTNAEVLQELINIKASDKNDIILWRTTYLRYITNGKVAQIGWKDNTLALIMSTTIDRKETVLRDRKRPKTTSLKAKTSRVLFSNNPCKVLLIPKVYNEYNFNMLQVNQFDHMTSQNDGLRPVRRRGYQSIKHWLLRSVLINTYLLALYSDVAEPR